MTVVAGLILFFAVHSTRFLSVAAPVADWRSGSGPLNAMTFFNALYNPLWNTAAGDT